MGRKNRRLPRRAGVNTSDRSRPQQHPSLRETNFIINNDGDLTTKVHEHDPFDSQNHTVEIQSFKVNKDLLVSASAAFNAMLTHQDFTEADSLSVDLHGDAGVTCRAMGVVLRGLNLYH